MTTADTPVQHERRGSFHFARLNRADKRNALSEPMLDGLLAVFEAVRGDDSARGLVLWGAGANFCAGADFSSLQQLLSAPATPGQDAVDPIAAHNRRFGVVLEQLVALPVASIAVVRGAAIGGGCGLAAACDRVVTSDDATFACPEVRLGVAPAQIAPFLVRRMGAVRASWLMMCAQRLDAESARSAGLADVVATTQELPGAVHAELGLLAAVEPAALRATKVIAARSLTLPLAAALGGAAADFAVLLRSGVPLEGMAASRERRAPAWASTVPDLPEFA
jgi:isohexenylglutaconyl-CoA hydratase